MKKTTKERTTRQIIAHIEGQLLPTGAADSMYRSGWNGACEALVFQLKNGEHLAKTTKCGKHGCIHPAGHVEGGQPIHSDGGRTWRDRK